MVGKVNTAIFANADDVTLHIQRTEDRLFEGNISTLRTIIRGTIKGPEVEGIYICRMESNMRQVEFRTFKELRYFE